MKTLPLAIALSATLLVGTSTVAFAQVAESAAPAQTKKAPKNARAVKVVNLPSASIAYWLDPKNNARPSILGTVELPKTTDKGAFTLPEGIENVTSIDEQNVVLITGTAEAIWQVEDMIRVLDQPLRQVEIEAQFVELALADANAFGIDFSAARATPDAATAATNSASVKGAFQVGFVRNNFTARLNALLVSDKAKLITAPRVTAINNLTAIITAHLETNIVNFAIVDTNVGYSVTPTINGDDTITLLIAEASEPVAGKTNLKTVANIRDGDTILLAGMTSLRPVDKDHVIVVFLTVRIIRRASDNIKVPKT